MCTVSIIPVESPDAAAPGAFRVVCNRDESRRRVAAAAPRWRPAGEGTHRAIWPMDLAAGGTWIAANEAGLCLCLLNLNPDHPRPAREPERARSRGLVVPALLGAVTAEEAAERLSRMPLARFAPFRLIAASPDPCGGAPRIFEARWDRGDLSQTWHAGPPMCFVSSGLGDRRVLPRLDLFEALVVEPGPTPARQDAFHRHSWSGQTEISIMMSRPDARTVSVTSLHVSPAGRLSEVTMTYEAITEGAILPIGSLARSSAL